MIIIKKIEFIKAVYDDTLSHNIYSIANIEFKNSPPIQGALLYWNHAEDVLQNKSDDVRFYYEEDSNGYFTSVKFPRNHGLNLEQRIELTRLLLDERSEIGSYTIATNAVVHNKKAKIHRDFNALQFPSDFDPTIIPYSANAQLEEDELNAICHNHPTLSREFVESYCKWRAQVLDLHPEEFEQYLDYIDFSAICYGCHQLSESYLILHLDQVNYEALQYNTAVIARLSPYFIEQTKGKLSKEVAQQLHLEKYLQQPSSSDNPIEEDTLLMTLLEYNHEHWNDDQEKKLPYKYFVLDRGIYRWPGAEHLIKNIPSFASKQYDQYGYKKLTNAEMDKLIHSLSDVQLNHYAAILEPHWLHRYREQIDWKIVSKENPYLESSFIEAHLKYIDFDALGENYQCKVDTAFLNKYFERFNHAKSLPIFVRHLTLGFFLEHQDKLQIDEKLFKKSFKTIPFDDYTTIASMLGFETDEAKER